MAWFLDTNIIVFCLRGKSAAAMRRLLAVPASDVLVPLQVHAELLVGAAKSNNPGPAKTQVLSFLAPFGVAWPDAAVGDHYVAIRTHIEAVGTPIGEADLWIAATVLSRGEQRPDCQVYHWTLPERLPRLPVPLRAPDADILIDLNAVLATACDRGRFGRRLPYKGSLPAHLPEGYRNWVESLVRQSGTPKGS